jgi:hypothetical protein
VVTAYLANPGNTHITLSGSVGLSRLVPPPALPAGVEYLGEPKYAEVASVPFRSPGWVLPGHTVFLAVSCRQPLADGEYRADLAVSYGGESAALGQVLFVIEKGGVKVKEAGAGARQP